MKSEWVSGDTRVCCGASSAIRTIVLVLAAAFVVAPVAAGQLDIPNRRGLFTPGELALLPPYCSAQQGMRNYTGPGGARWRQQFGDDLQHIHHYCRGLRDEMFAKMLSGTTPAQRHFLWNRSVGEFDYMIRNSTPAMPLLPEIHFKRGEALLRLGQVAQAEEAFQNSRRLKPDYWPPYAAWIDKLIELKLYARASELLDEGLQQMPGESQLLSRIEHLPGRRTARQAVQTSSSAASSAKVAAPAASSGLPAEHVSR